MNDDSLTEVKINKVFSVVCKVEIEIKQIRKENI